MNSNSKIENSSLILHLIKSCENYQLTEKESLETISKILGKDISRRTYYNYKKKLYDKDILKQLKNSMYDSQMMRCLLLDLEDTDKDEGERADKLVAEQLSDRKDIFHDTVKQQVELAKSNEMTKAMLNQSEEIFDKPIQIYNSIPKKSTVKEEFVKCGKEICNVCPHGPYYYAYWRDNTSRKLKKKYLGMIDPRQ